MSILCFFFLSVLKDMNARVILSLYCSRCDSSTPTTVLFFNSPSPVAPCMPLLHNPVYDPVCLLQQGKEEGGNLMLTVGETELLKL